MELGVTFAEIYARKNVDAGTYRESELWLLQLSARLAHSITLTLCLNPFINIHTSLARSVLALCFKQQGMPPLEFSLLRGFILPHSVPRARTGPQMKCLQPGWCNGIVTLCPGPVASRRAACRNEATCKQLWNRQTTFGLGLYSPNHDIQHCFSKDGALEH